MPHLVKIVPASSDVCCESMGRFHSRGGFCVGGARNCSGGRPSNPKNQFSQKGGVAAALSHHSFKQDTRVRIIATRSACAR
jgi:hypothetical protein